MEQKLLRCSAGHGSAQVEGKNQMHSHSHLFVVPVLLKVRPCCVVHRQEVLHGSVGFDELEALTKVLGVHVHLPQAAQLRCYRGADKALRGALAGSARV